MDWQQSVLDASARALAETGLPRRLLRRLLVDHHLGIGSRALIVGCADGRLPAALAGLGLDVVGIDACEDHVRTASEDAPALDVRRLPAAGPLPFEAESFDLVMLRGCPNRPSSSHTLSETADCLALLRPRGCFALVAETDEVTEDEIAQRLGTFPGEIAVNRFGTAAFAPWSWMRFEPSVRQRGFVLATLRTPRDSMSRQQWQCLADVATETDSAALRLPAA